MFDLIKRIFGERLSSRAERPTERPTDRLSDRQREPSSGSMARDRLKILLVHDRSSIAPEVMSLLKDDIIMAVTKYMDIDQSAIEIDLSRSDDSVALVASVPVIRLKRFAVREEAPGRDVSNANRRDAGNTNRRNVTNSNRRRGR
ncbi:MAG: cell division topological specificity factor MinE [Bacillota bacterium]|nr:cell division topological specificity factor MinE [Bacillota bacterium]